MSQSFYRCAAAGVILLSAVLPIPAVSQQPSPAPSTTEQQGGPAAAPDEGIPVTDADVLKACGSCHVRDDKQRMTRISYRRATPENWELTVRRMMSLNKVQIPPDVARRVIKSLSDSHGLAPEEARSIMFDAERRLVDFTYSADMETNDLCRRCHSIGRVLSERRTRDEWNGLIAMHRYYYPGVDGGSGGFRRGGPPAPGRGAAATGRGRAGDSGRGGENQQPVDRALTRLIADFPLISQEWTAWSAAMRTPRLAGRWALAGYEIGKGPVYGQVTISDRPDMADSFLTDGRFVYAKGGQTVTRRSRAIVYTGFQWRGRSADTPDDPGTWREVAFIERNGQEIKGRWFTGGHDETGIDITLRRVSNDPLVSGTDVGLAEVIHISTTRSYLWRQSSRAHNGGRYRLRSRDTRVACRKRVARGDRDRRRCCGRCARRSARSVACGIDQAVGGCCL